MTTIQGSQDRFAAINSAHGGDQSQTVGRLGPQTTGNGVQGGATGGLPDVFILETGNPGALAPDGRSRRTTSSFETDGREVRGTGDEQSVARDVFVGDIAKFLARALIEFAGEQRQAALDGRLAAREAAKAELLDQADNMDKSADKMQSGAMTSLITGVIGGSLSMLGSMTTVIGSTRQMSAMTGAMKDTKSATAAMNSNTELLGDLRADRLMATDASHISQVNLAIKATKESQQTVGAAQSAARQAFDVASAKSQLTGAYGQLSGAGGDTTRGIGSSLDQREQAEGKRADADGARDAAEAQYHQQAADMKKEIQDSMNEMIKQIINFIKEMREAEVDAMRSLTRV